MNKRTHWIGWLIVATILPFLVQGSVLFSTQYALTYLVFFLFGVGLFRFQESLFSKHMIWTARGLFFLSMLAWTAIKLEVLTPSPEVMRLLLVVAGMSGCHTLLALKLHLPWLASLGLFSYTIYLYHGFGFEAVVPLQFLVGFDAAGQAGWLLLAIAVGLALPIALDLGLRNVRYLRAPVLGRRW